jgi:hypothetical protein
MSRWYQASLTSAEAVGWKARVLTLPKWDNNIVEQGPRRVKFWIGPMLSFKRFANAAIVSPVSSLPGSCAQFKIHRLVKQAGDIHDVWMAVLGA